MDDEDDIRPPLETLVDCLLGWTAVTAQIIDHMQRSQAATGRTEPPIAEALYALMNGTLAPFAESREFEVGVAARIVGDAVETVMSEIMLLPIDGPERTPNRAQRRARARRRRG
jgi:hypothetical protein